MWVPLLTLLALIAIPNVSKAVDAGQGYGPGMRSCGEFAKEYAANPTVAEGLFFAWAQGFMSALNLSLVSSTGAYRRFDSNEMVAYKIHIRSYCDAHPLTQYVGAVMDLYKSLPARKANPN